MNTPNRLRFAGALSMAMVVIVAAVGCVNGRPSPLVGPVVNGVDQIACAIAAVIDPKDSTYIASVCAVAVPAVNGVIGGLSAADRASAPCKLVPVTPDGHTGYGVACSRFCGDGATDADPCPRVDAALRAELAKAARK